MGSFTNTYEQAVLNALCGNNAPLASTSMWVALFTAAPSDASGGTEATGGNYARKSSGAWTSATALVANAATVTFATCTSTVGSVTHFALMTDSATGNMVGWATLSAARDLATNDVAAFEVGSLTISLD